MAVDLGDTITFRSDLFDKPVEEGGVLANAVTATLTVTLPDGTVLSPAPVIVNPPATTGKYFYRYSTTSAIGAGSYDGAWLFTMASGQTSAYFEHFDVRQPYSILGLAEAKKHLNIPVADTTDDEELRGWLGAITRLVEGKAGEVTRKSFTERHRAGRSLWLRHPPVISVTSIVPWLGTGSTYATADVRVTEGGRVELLSGLCFSGGPFAVTYVAGRAIAQANVVQAAQIILKHCWETQRGASALPLQAADEMSMVPGFGFAVPNRALELLSPDLLSGNYA
jgi:hypothetical protein